MTEKNYQLLMQKGPTPGQIYPINAILITLGRDPLADIIVSDPEVSRQHARLMETESGYELQDLGSTNGTFVNGRRLGGEAVLLQAGEKIEMGSGVVFLFQAADEQIADSPISSSIPSHVAETAAYHSDEAENIPDLVDDLVPEPLHVEPESAVLGDRIDWAEASPAQQEASQPKSAVFPPSPPSEAKRHRPMLMAIGVALLLFACCCSFTLFMWFIGGDWLLTQLGFLP